MLTKGDLTAIQKIFDSSKKETNEKFSSIDERFDSMDKRFDSMDKRFESMDKKFESKIDGLSGRVDELADRLQKNTEELIELITTGFNSYEERFRRLEKEVFKTN